MKLKELLVPIIAGLLLGLAIGPMIYKNKETVEASIIDSAIIIDGGYTTLTVDSVGTLTHTTGIVKDSIAPSPCDPPKFQYDIGQDTIPMPQYEKFEFYDPNTLQLDYDVLPVWTLPKYTMPNDLIDNPAIWGPLPEPNELDTLYLKPMEPKGPEIKPEYRFLTDSCKQEVCTKYWIFTDSLIYRAWGDKNGEVQRDTLITEKPYILADTLDIMVIEYRTNIGIIGLVYEEKKEAFSAICVGTNDGDPVYWIIIDYNEKMEQFNLKQ